MNELRESELRDLLERVATIDGDVDVDRHWSAGRRRRARRGASVAVAACLGLLVAAGAVAQTGLLGGTTTTPLPTGPAAVPDSLETFVFAAPGESRPPDVTALLVHATRDALAGTSWVLQDGMWNAPTSASGLTGTSTRTILSFEEGGPGPEAWAVQVGGCGLASLPELALDTAGAFGPLDPTTTDIGCADQVQAAEDFWLDALSGGGQLTLAGGGRWLLLSVDAPAQPTPSDPADPGPDPVPTADPAPTDGPAPTGPPRQDVVPTDQVDHLPTGSGVPGDEGTGVPTGDPAPTPTPDAGPSPTTGAGTAPSPGGGPGTAPTVPQVADGFTAPGAASVDPPWPAGGGELFAPSVRAGVHDGFDRVVVDLTGTGDPGWRAAWTDDPRLDGSGLASDIAGDSVLELSLSGMGYPEPDSDVYAEGTFGLDTHALSAVVEVHRTAPYEGMLQVLVGVRGDPRPYRVFLLQDPVRLVIDVQTAP